MKCRKYRFNFLLFCILLPVLTILVFRVPLTARSSDPPTETDFPKKRITWIVTYPPGGGYDTYSRAIARVLPKYLPNEVDVLVKNVNGAGGRRGTAFLYRSKPDGYTIGMLNPGGLISSDLVKVSSDYDLDKFEFLATCSQSVALLYVRTGSKYSSLEKMQKADRVEIR